MSPAGRREPLSRPDRLEGLIHPAADHIAGGGWPGYDSGAGRRCDPRRLLNMDDIVAAPTRSAQDAQPRLDLQEHIADLAAKGLITRIDHPINKDTELHPLVRLQFIGGIPESERRAFLFTNVVDGSGRRYDMPVVVGVIAASA